MNSNINIPVIQCFVRAKMISRETGFLPCEIIAVRFTLNKPITFHIMLESGAMYDNIPLHAFCWHKKATPVKLTDISWWDSQSNYGECNTIWYLTNYEADFKNRSGNIIRGQYITTFYNLFNTDYPYGYAQDASAKCFHLLKLANGNFCLSPNTFLRWDCGDNFVDWNIPIPKLITNEMNLTSERREK